MNPILQHAIERVERPGGSHEGVGRKKKRVPVSLALSLCQYVLRPRRGLGQASPSLEAPRLQAGNTGTLSSTEQKGKIVMTKTSRSRG